MSSHYEDKHCKNIRIFICVLLISQKIPVPLNFSLIFILLSIVFFHSRWCQLSVLTCFAWQVRKHSDTDITVAPLCKTVCPDEQSVKQCCPGQKAVCHFSKMSCLPSQRNSNKIKTKQELSLSGICPIYQLFTYSMRQLLPFKKCIDCTISSSRKWESISLLT